MNYNELTLLQKLISIPSPSGSEMALCSFISEFLRENGIVTELQPVKDESCNLLARIGRGSSFTVVLSAHMDTETLDPGISWQYEPFSGQEVRGRIYGRGANDTKGNLSSFIQAFCELKDSVSRGELILALTCREETDSSGAYALGKHPWLSGREITGALVGEPCFDEKYKNIFRTYPGIWLGGTGRCEIGVSGDLTELLQAGCLLEGELSEKYDPVLGAGYYRVRACRGFRDGNPSAFYTITGESRHGSGEKISRNLAVDVLRLSFRFQDILWFSAEPLRGDDGYYYLSLPGKAMIALSDSSNIDEIRTLTDKLGYTLSQSEIFEKPADNYLLIDRNTVFNETESEISEDLKRRIRRFSGISMEFLKRNPPFLKGWQQPVNHNFTQTINSSIREINGRAPLAIYRMGPSDANIFSADFNWNTVVYGTYGGNLHSKDEWVTCESVTEVKNTVKRMVQKLEGKS